MHVRIGVMATMVAWLVVAPFASAQAGHEFKLKLDGVTTENSAAVGEALKGIENVKDVKVDPAAGQVVVVMNGDANLSSQAVTKAIEPTKTVLKELAAPAGTEAVWILAYNGGGG